MSDTEDDKTQPTLEHRILIQLRQVLAAVVRDVTPPPGMRNPLSEQTIEDIRAAFALIAARERELRGDAPPDLPQYRDRGPGARIVEFDRTAGNSRQGDDQDPD
ncbi:MAG: segregation and condensation protein A [Gammaproteobacteria bacterium]|nr:segregation and condensation protein A [Gammaproteobacteria bacterium]